MTSTHVHDQDHRLALPPAWLAAIAFACTLVIWVVAYILSMPGMGVSAWVLITAAGLVIGAGGWVLGRSLSPAPVHSIMLGAAVTAINLLILGSFGSGADAGQVIRTALPWIGGFLIAAIILSLAGQFIGRATAAGRPTADSWLGRFALVVAATTLVLLTAGGVVTGLEAGMAVPDWLTTFSYPMVLYPLELMREEPGRYFEHFHRLWGLLVGLSTIVLAILLFRHDTRRWVKWTGLGILLLVIVQGVMGGTRITENNLVLAIIHGVFGQMLFALLVTMAAFTSARWLTAPPPAVVEKGRTDHTLAASLVGVLIAQIALGAVYRHLSSDPTIAHAVTFGLVNAHMTLGILIAVKLVFVGIRTWAKRRDQQPLSRLGLSLLILTPAQIVLGLVAYVLVEMADREPGDAIPPIEVAFTSAHQVVGALLLAASALLFVWTRRLIEKTNA